MRQLRVWVRTKERHSSTFHNLCATNCAAFGTECSVSLQIRISFESYRGKTGRRLDDFAQVTINWPTVLSRFPVRAFA